MPSNLASFGFVKISFLIFILLCLTLFGFFAVPSFPWQRSFLSLSPTVWFLLASAYIGGIVFTYFLSGIPLYVGPKRYFAIVDLSLLSILVYTSGGITTPVYPIFYFHILGFTIQNDNYKLSKLDVSYLFWYIPILTFSWFIPCFFWGKELCESVNISLNQYYLISFTQFSGVLILGLIVSIVAQVREPSDLLQMLRKKDEENRIRLAQKDQQLLQQKIDRRRLKKGNQEGKAWKNFTIEIFDALLRDLQNFSQYEKKFWETNLQFLKQATKSIDESDKFINSLGLELIDIKSLMLESYRVANPKERESIPLECQFITEDSKQLERGASHLLQLIFTEIIREILRGSDSKSYLKVLISSYGSDIHIKWVARLSIEERHGPPDGINCPVCQVKVRSLSSFRQNEELLCERCIKSRIEQALQDSSEPDQKKDSPFRLYLVHYLLTHFYFGTLTCGIHYWGEREIFIGMNVPKNLASKIEEQRL